MILCFRCSIRLLLCRIAVDVSELVPERYWVGGHEHAYQDSTVVRDQGRHAGDTLWDFKVSGYPPNPRYTLQLLIYWRMGLHSVHPEYQSIRRLGFFNPRRNEVWLLDVDRITPELIDWTDRELIGYPA